MSQQEQFEFAPEFPDDRRFREFHRDNPKVYAKLVELARLVKSRGFDSYSIKSLFEQVRWHYHMETNDPDFKLNNNYHSRYARLIMRNESDLREFFQTRTLSTEKSIWSSYLYMADKVGSDG